MRPEESILMVKFLLTRKVIHQRKKLTSSLFCNHTYKAHLRKYPAETKLIMILFTFDLQSYFVRLIGGQTTTILLAL